MSAFGIVDRDPYDPASAPFDDRNLALPIGFNFPSSCKAAHRNLGLSSAAARLHLRCISAASPLHLVSPPPPPRKVAELFEAKFLQKTAREMAEMRP